MVPKTIARDCNLSSDVLASVRKFREPDRLVSPVYGRILFRLIIVFILAVAPGRQSPFADATFDFTRPSDCASEIAGLRKMIEVMIIFKVCIEDLLFLLVSMCRLQS